MDAEPADAHERGGLLDRLRALRDRGKPPNSASVLTAWVNQAQTSTRLEADRLSWLIASAVVVAVLQRALLEDGRSRFLLKGGTYLQYRLDWTARPTKDIDGLIRGDLDEFMTAVDTQLKLPWGPLSLERTEVEVIESARRLVKPRRFDVLVKLKGKTWRRVQIEISPDEGGAAEDHDVLEAPDLKHFGLPSSTEMFGITLRYQIAQKIHACSDPHSPPEQHNDRARDAVDLLLLKQLVESTGTPSLADIKDACVRVFDARAQEAEAMGHPARAWPATVVAHPHWETDYSTAAAKGGVDSKLEETVAQVNAWILLIAAS